MHTIYSFSPYSPAWHLHKAWEAGLLAVGLMDHDSIAGAFEMAEASMYFGIASTSGSEIRVNFTGTEVEGRKVNNPDSGNIVYIALHGVPERSVGKLAEFLVPINDARNRRNRRMVEKLNSIAGALGLPQLDFDRDVFALSEAASGGSITERHILYALSKVIVKTAGRGKPLIRFIEEKLRITVPQKIKGFLLEPENPHELFDLLGLLKSTFLQEFLSSRKKMNVLQFTIQ